MSYEKRQLAAIMFTDVVGYSAHMAENEKKALEILEICRPIRCPGQLESTPLEAHKYVKARYISFLEYSP